jgi:4-methyl-5(b-hydroxyethyl)-thiazole monophosphate biosynthesis
MQKTALILLADGFEEIEALTPIDLLRRAGVTVTVAAIGQHLQVRGAHDILIVADLLLAHFSESFDALIIPGGQPGTRNLCANQEVIALVGNAFRTNILCAAICAAPMVFDKAGILTGRRFTCFPGIEKEIRSGTFCTDSVVEDGNIITSRGAGTAIPFALRIIAALCGEAAAQAMAKTIVYT